MEIVENRVNDLEKSVCWITGLAAQFGERLPTPVIQVYADALAHDAFLMDDEMAKVARNTFDVFPTIAELGGLFDDNYGSLEPGYVPLQLAKAAVDHWWPPVRGLGHWGRIAAAAWLTQQAMLHLEARAIRRQKVATGWVLMLPPPPTPSVPLVRLWRDETALKMAFVGVE